MTEKQIATRVGFAKTLAREAGELARRYLLREIEFSAEAKGRRTGWAPPITPSGRWFAGAWRTSLRTTRCWVRKAVANWASRHGWSTRSMARSISCTEYATGVSIAFLAHGQRRIRVIHDPSLDELFWMVRGGGAFCDERRIAVSSCRRLDQVLLCIGYVPRHSLREHLRVKQHLHEAGAAVKDIFDALTGLVQASQDASGERSSAQ